MPTAEPYLTLDGAEVINGLRTLTYLRRGLSTSAYDVHLASPLTPEHGYDDVYGDAYEADPFWPGNLSCYCAILDTGPFVAPDTDPAPWFDSSRPESADFFGILADVVVSDVAVRSVSARSSGGGTLGRLHLRPRLVQVTGIMHAATTAAMAWGERWLAQALAGPATGCGGGAAEVLLACPPAEAAEPESYRRELAEVGLVDGPVFEGIRGVGACYAQGVNFQLAAGDPYLRLPAIDALPDTWLRADPTPCCVVAGPQSLGDTAARITLRAGHVGHTLTGVRITATLDSTCPSAAEPFASYDVVAVQPGCELVIDAANNTVTVTRALTGEVIGGPDAIDHEGLLPWVVAKAGEDVCVCVDASAARPNAGSLVLVESVGREL